MEVVLLRVQQFDGLQEEAVPQAAGAGSNAEIPSP